MKFFTTRKIVRQVDENSYVSIFKLKFLFITYYSVYLNRHGDICDWAVRHPSKKIACDAFEKHEVIEKSERDREISRKKFKKVEFDVE